MSIKMPNLTMSVSPSQVDFLVSGKTPTPTRTDFSFNLTVPKPPKGIIIPRFDQPQTSASMESINTGGIVGEMKIAMPMFAAAT
jgi:hypothetical protein